MPITPMYIDGPGDYKDNEGVIIEYVMDTAAEKDDLPTGATETDWKKKPRPGSRAVVAETPIVFVLNSAREWKEW